MQVIGSLDARGGGPIAVVQALSARLAADGHQVEIVTTDAVAGEARADVVYGTTRHRAGYDVTFHRCERPAPPYISLAHAWDVWRRAPTFDVVHVHGAFNLPVTLGARLTGLRGVPYVVRTCGMFDAWSLQRRRGLKRGYYALLERWNLAGAARIHVSTEAEAEALAQLGFRDTVALLPQGVEPPDFGASDAAGGDAEGRRYVLFLSRIAEKKGLVPLVRGFARVAAAFPDVDLVIAGPDEFRHRAVVEAEAIAAGLGARVRFPGMVSGPAKGTLFRGAEAFALTSWDENFGIVVIEAAHAELPVIVSEEVGLSAAVRRHEAGAVCAVDEASIAGALTRVLSRGKAAYGAGVRALADDYRWERRYPPIVAMYRDVVAQSRRCASSR
jgi:glycosyltransferase involved in cell wall biosynthesis